MFGDHDDADNCPVHSLPSALLVRVLSLLSPRDAARAACVHSSWRGPASDELLWQGHCRDAWGLEQCRGPTGEELPAFKVAYAAWQQEYGEYGSLFARAHRCVAGLRAWTATHLPPVAASLAGGAAEEQLAEAERALGVALPPAYRAFMRLCNGQLLEFDRVFDSNNTFADHESAFHGLLGGYSVYDHRVSVRLLPLERVRLWSSQITGSIRRRGDRPQSAWVLIAASFSFNKLFFLDCSDGLVYVGTRLLMGTARMMGCTGEGSGVPEGERDRRLAGQADGPPLGHDGFLRWMEAYLEQLQRGVFGVQRLEPDDPMSKGICLFPETEPQCAVAVTNRVQIRVSATLLPEHSIWSPRTADNLVFSYSVRMRLLPPPEGSVPTGPMARATTCQLSMRCWHSLDDSGPPRITEGEGVIGQFPLLVEGGEEYVYQSMSSIQGLHGTMQGHFTITPGSLAHPQGPTFNAQVPLFHMELPPVIF